MKMRQFLTVLSSLTVLAAAVGCQHPARHPAPEGAYVPAGKPGSPEAAGYEVVLLNHDLKRTLAVDRPIVAQRNESGLLTIQVGLRNRTNDESLQIQAQTLFFDALGNVLYSQPGSETAWQTLTVSPNQTLYYKSQALTAEAARFTVRGRYTKNAK